MTTLNNQENEIISVENSILTNSEVYPTPGITKSLIQQNMGNGMMPS